MTEYGSSLSIRDQRRIMLAIECPTTTSSSLTRPKEKSMLWTVFVILLILWLLGFSFHIAGGLIHLLLVVAVVVLVINLISGRRAI